MRSSRGLVGFRNTNKAKNRSKYAFWLVLVPPAVTTIVGTAILLKLGSATWLDAQTWPTEFRGAAHANDALAGSGICRAFVFITAFLVFLNNSLLYLREIRRVGEEARPDSPKGRTARSAAFWLAVIATLIVCFWLIDTVLSILPATATKHELFALTSFLLFGVIDWMLSANARATSRDTWPYSRQARLEAEADYYGRQASYTDSAVVVGMLILLAIQHLLSRLPAFGSRFEWGFATGAIGMHLAYSQFVFLALTLRHRKTMNQISAEELAAATPDNLRRI
ncbi:MAG TPA: hypothetical protein VKY89_23720 [Thermoanaerobaculia bacterium]|nr:hypothetical protein [Thermoanaerobaculia bacterium]